MIAGFFVFSVFKTSVVNSDPVGSGNFPGLVDPDPELFVPDPAKMKKQTNN